MSFERLKMKLLLQDQQTQQLQDRWPCRPITPRDIPALAQLILDAYKGTIDDEGETPDEALKAMQDTFDGASGRLLNACSFVIEERGQALACSIVTEWHEQPLLAYVMTHPAAQNRGMGRFLIQKSIESLLAQGYHELSLFVTKGNLPAQHLYDTLGFQVLWMLGSADLNGTRIYYEVAGDGQPLVLLHAGLTTSEMWDAQWRLLRMPIALSAMTCAAVAGRADRQEHSPHAKTSLSSCAFWGSSGRFSSGRRPAGSWPSILRLNILSRWQR